MYAVRCKIDGVGFRFASPAGWVRWNDAVLKFSNREVAEFWAEARLGVTWQWEAVEVTITESDEAVNCGTGRPRLFSAARLRGMQPKAPV